MWRSLHGGFWVSGEHYIRKTHDTQTTYANCHPLSGMAPISSHAIWGRLKPLEASVICLLILKLEHLDIDQKSCNQGYLNQYRCQPEFPQTHSFIDLSLLESERLLTMVCSKQRSRYKNKNNSSFTRCSSQTRLHRSKYSIRVLKITTHPTAHFRDVQAWLGYAVARPAWCGQDRYCWTELYSPSLGISFLRQC